MARKYKIVQTAPFTFEVWYKKWWCWWAYQTWGYCRRDKTLTYASKAAAEKFLKQVMEMDREADALKAFRPKEWEYPPNKIKGTDE